MLICYNLSLLNTHVICALWIGIVNYRKDKYSMAYPLYGLSTKLLSDLNLVDAEVVDDPAEFLGLRREEVEEEVEEEEEEARPIFESSFSERNESYNEISPSKDRMTDVSWDEKATEDDNNDEEDEEEEQEEEDPDEIDETLHFGQKYAKTILEEADLADDEMEEQAEMR